MKKYWPVGIVIIILVAFSGTIQRAASEGIVPWFQISITSYLQDNPGVAANTTNNQFLVVWEDWRGTSGFGTDVYAQVVNSDMTLDGGNFLITGAADWQRGPKVDYSPVNNKYLVVWEDWQADDIYGRLVNANGTTSGASFPIAAAAEYQWNADLAYGSNADQYLVVFDDDRIVPGDKDINGQFINSDGTLSGANFTVSGPSSDQLLPAVAYNSLDNQFLVVWQDDRNAASDDDIYGRVINANGTYDGQDFPISTAGPDQDDVDIAYASSANLFLVVWEQSNDIYGRLVRADKSFVGSEFQIASSSSGVDDPVVAYDSHADQFLVLWHDYTGWDNIYAQQVSTDGTMLDDDLDLITGTGNDINAALAYSTSTRQFMAAWQRQTCNDFSCDDYDKDIYGAFYQATGNFKVNLPMVLRAVQPTVPPPPTATVPAPTATPVTPVPTPTNTRTPTPTAPPDPWELIFIDGFEVPFPGTNWDVFEGTGSGTGEYFWGKRTCRYFSYTNSAWAVGGGAQGSGLPCGSNYPNNVVSWMRYGPFSLANATDADFRFNAWINTEPTYDYVCRLASTDGINFYGDCSSGDSGGWISQVLDLSNVTDLGSVLGENDVWIAIYFFSDSSITDSEGVYVDDVLIQKCTTGNCTRSPMVSMKSENTDLISFPMAITVNQP